MKTYTEFSLTEAHAKGAISAGDAKTAEARKIANYLKPIIKSGAPLEKELTRLSDEARELGNSELKDKVDALRKALSPAFMALSKFTKA